MRQTHTYATLEVSEATFQDIYDRIAKCGKEYLWEYYDENEDILVLGTVGLIKEGRGGDE